MGGDMRAGTKSRKAAEDVVGSKAEQRVQNTNVLERRNTKGTHTAEPNNQERGIGSRGT